MIPLQKRMDDSIDCCWVNAFRSFGNLCSRCVCGLRVCGGYGWYLLGPVCSSHFLVVVNRGRHRLCGHSGPLLSQEQMQTLYHGCEQFLFGFRRLSERQHLLGLLDVGKQSFLELVLFLGENREMLLLLRCQVRYGLSEYRWEISL